MKSLSEFLGEAIVNESNDSFTNQFNSFLEIWQFLKGEHSMKAQFAKKQNNKISFVVYDRDVETYTTHAFSSKGYTQPFDEFETLQQAIKSIK